MPTGEPEPATQPAPRDRGPRHLAGQTGEKAAKVEREPKEPRRPREPRTVPIRVAPYPAYGSQFNPSERRLLSHVTSACQGVRLDA